MSAEPDQRCDLDERYDAASRALVDFFVQVASKSDPLIGKIRTEQNFDVNDERWCFTLPNLHAFLIRHSLGSVPKEYRDFRKVLLNSPVNSALRTLSATIVIIDNTGKVDRSTYALLWNYNANSD